jgi:hypothetical protein
MREDDVRAPDIGMVPLGYGRFVRADEIVALLPIEDGRGPRRRTYVHVAGARGAHRGFAIGGGDPHRHEGRESFRPPRNAVRRPHRTARDLSTSSPKPPGLRHSTRLGPSVTVRRRRSGTAQRLAPRCAKSAWRCLLGEEDIRVAGGSPAMLPTCPIRSRSLPPSSPSLSSRSPRGIGPAPTATSASCLPPVPERSLAGGMSPGSAQGSRSPWCETFGTFRRLFSSGRRPR